VDQQKEHERQRNEEVKRARGLLAANTLTAAGNRGNEGGGHRQARPDYQGKQNEDHEYSTLRRWSTLYDQASASLGRSKRK
jgi:hypothetical protein